MKCRKSLATAFFSLLSIGALAQNASKWADSVMRTLSEEEKIAQLIMVRMSTIDAKTRTVTFFDSTVESDVRTYLSLIHI